MHRKPYRRAGSTNPRVTWEKGIDRTAALQAAPGRGFDTAPSGPTQPPPAGP
ncbi:MAG: hypothetical protein NZM15_07945 [Flavobacteriales bacterium]|nr:hypothetical protein [Flavobacteriales bacterium]MDW8432617.1 hypothetical protein [Flavobacteriales bacterium]